jgi:hypothetical protein
MNVQKFKYLIVYFLQRRTCKQVFGEKRYYMCDKQFNCPKNCYLFFPSNSTKVHLFICNLEHLHDPYFEKKVDRITKEKILDLLGNNLRNDEILESINREKISKITSKQLKNLKHYNKKILKNKDISK